MANKIVNDITLLFNTKLDENSKREVGKNLKSLLENAVIGFDEAETKKNLQPIIQMMKRMFDKADMAFDADKLLGMPSRQALQAMADLSIEQLQTAFDRALSKSGGIKIDFGNIDLSSMTEPLERLTQELSEIGERVASTTKKSVQDIEKSLRTLDKTKKLDKTVGDVEKTLSVANSGKHITSATKATTLLEKTRDAYAESVANNDPWEVQYQHLLTFVTKYEAMTKKIKPIIDTNHPEFKQLYELLSPKAGAVKISLEHFVDVAKGRELSEYKNQPWARESTLKKIEQTLRNGISVKGSVGDNNDGDSQNPPSPDSDEGDGDKNKRPNTKVPADTGESEEAKAARLVREAEEKARIEAAEKIRREEEKITKTIKERKPYVMFRAVESPESSGKSKEDALSDYGAEVWAQDQESAISYANDQRGVSSLLAARIKPVNPLIFDANDNFWSDFDKIPGLKEFFPNLLGYIKEHDEFDTQKYIHEQAKELGFDSVIFENVRDNLDAETDEDADITTTIAVLDDRIVSLEGAFAQLEELDENGSKVFDSKLSSPPEFYVPPESIDPEQYLQELQDRQAKINGAYENVMSSFNATLDEQRQKLQNAEKELANNPKSSLAKGHVEDAKAEVENTEQIISKFQQQMQYNQRALQIEIDDYARALGKSIDVESEKIDVVSDIQKETTAHEENSAAIVAEARATEELKEAKSILPTADGLEAHTYAPSDEQKEYVLKLGEEYRAIMSILEQGDSEFEAALIERAKAIQHIMLETVRGNDGDLVYEYQNIYGGSTKTAASLGDWRQQDNLLHNVDRDKIDDSQRQAAIDLIYQELEAEKQLEAERLKAREAAKQREVDAFNSKYSSASEEEKKLLYEIIELEKEFRTLSDIGDEESHRLALETLQKVREKENALEKLNAELVGAYDDVGFKRAAPHIKAPPHTIEPSVATPNKSLGDSFEVKASIDTEELRSLLTAITYNVKVVQDAESTEDNNVSIDEAALESVLNRITYNVKIAHDDADKTANKIAIDEGALEQTLHRVFANVLNPKVEQAETEVKNEPWALENTLQSVRGALDSIQTNTSKIGAVPQTPVDDVDSTLAQISKNIVEINTKIVKGSKATTKDTIKAQKSQANRDTQILAERIETQKLALKKFKTELETSGRMTEDVSKKIRGLAISLGMVKDGKGLTRWGEKFKQQKLDIGITDISTKESIAEQNANIKEWISLSKQLGELDAKINSGLFDDAIIAQAKQERELVLRKIEEVMGLINNPDDGFIKAGEANFAGHYDIVETEKSKQIGKLISQYEKLGQLQARAETSGAFVDREKYEQLNREVQSETEILNLREEQNSELLEALQTHQENAYISEKDIEYAKEQKRLFAEYVSLVKQIGKLDGIINSDTADTISKLNAQTEKDALMRLADDIRPQLDLTREDLISAGAASMAGEEASSITQRQKALVDLERQHKELGKLQAQEAHTQATALQKKIDAQHVVLQLTQEELDALTKITEEARQDTLNKQTDKDVKKQAANAKKLAQREAMLGKTGNAVGRAESTWLSAVGIEDELPDGFMADIEDYYQKLDALRKKHQELKNSDIISEEQKKDIIAQTMSVNKMTDEISELVAEYHRLSGDNATVIGANTLDSGAGLGAYEQQLKQAVATATNGKAQIKNFDAATKTLTYTVKTGKNEFTEYTAAVRHLDGQLVSVRGTTKRTETFFEATARKMRELTSYFSGMAVFNRVGQELRRGIQYVREIDDALVELRKVTDETAETYDQFLQTAAKTGEKLGATIAEVTEATSTFAKLGYTIEQSTEMAEAALVYKNVGDNIASTEDAADSIISTLKGFGLESSETMRIVDRFNEVGKYDCPGRVVICD